MARHFISSTTQTENDHVPSRSFDERPIQRSDRQTVFDRSCETRHRAQHDASDGPFARRVVGVSAIQRTARRGQSVSSADDALLKLATRLVAQQGHVTDAALGEVRQHGFDDGAIAEVIANVTLNILLQNVGSHTNTAGKDGSSD